MTKKELEQEHKVLKTKYKILISAFKLLARSYANKIIVCPSQQAIKDIEAIFIREGNYDTNGKICSKESQN